MGINAVGQRILESLFFADSFEYWLILTLDQSQTCELMLFQFLYLWVKP